jgi:hypothetical protein
MSIGARHQSNHSNHNEPSHASRNVLKKEGDMLKKKNGQA